MQIINVLTPAHVVWGWKIVKPEIPENDFFMEATKSNIKIISGNQTLHDILQIKSIR